MLTREASSDLRELVTGLEPDALRNQGFAAAVHLLVERVAGRRGIHVEIDATAGDALGENARVGLYQIVRESLDQALRRGPPTRVSVTVTATASGGVELVVSDDGSRERRQAVLDGLAERAASLNARVPRRATTGRGHGRSRHRARPRPAERARTGSHRPGSGAVVRIAPVDSLA